MIFAGGKSPAVVFEDADLNNAVNWFAILPPIKSKPVFNI
jgi:hypothetical protein